MLAKILSNEKINRDFFLMKVEHKNNAKHGQFFMLRSWERFPVLSRPISIFDRDEDSVSFLYKVVGSGTELFSKLKTGDEIVLDGPHGNFFSEMSGNIALVGGGVGIAPLYLLAKNLKKNSENKISIFLGFSEEAILSEEYEKISDDIKINVGGYITDDVDTTKYDYIVTCGPEIMMKKLYEKYKKENSAAKLFVSLENHMACGFGVCLVCSCKTKKGNKRVCVDGPIFLAEEVFDCE